jgi:hypothetical protein
VVKACAIMENKKEILAELRSISPLIADIQGRNPFVVPEGYFSTLPDALFEKIRLESFLTNPSVNAYEVPAGYFEELPEKVLSTIKSDIAVTAITEELDEVAPFLNTINRKEIYTVPAGYFAEADFSTAVQTVKNETKVVRFARRGMQYAAAALIAGILVTGAFLYTESNHTNAEKNEYLDVSSGLNTVSEMELVTYLDNPEHFVAAPAATSLASETDLVDVKNNIQRLSDEELTQYLKENAEPFETVVSEKE